MPRAERITSRQSPHVKRLRALRDPRRRREAAIFMIEGPRALASALDAGAELLEVWLAPKLRRVPGGRELEARVRGLPHLLVREVDDAVLEAVSDALTPQGVLALAPEPRVDLAGLLARGGDLLVLQDLQDPGNLGTCWRSAAAAGFSGIIQGEAGADPWSPKVLRAAAGACFVIPALRAAVDAALLTALLAGGLGVVAAAAQGATEFARADWRARVAILIGQEGPGLPAGLVTRAQQVVRIPMAPGVESLNAAVTASLLAFERARHRAAPCAATDPSGTIRRDPEGRRP